MTRNIMPWLGSLGLIPFAAGALAALWLPDSEPLQRGLSLYAFGIISYLCGTWWLNSSGPPVSWAMALVSHGVLLSAFFVLWLTPALFPGSAAVLLLLIFAVERWSDLAGRFEGAYLAVRLRLTLVAAACLTIAQVQGG